MFARVLPLMVALPVFCGCLAGMLPQVDEPVSAESALVVIEKNVIFEDHNVAQGYERTDWVNTVNSGFYPIVIGPNGDELALRILETSTRGGIYFYRENVPPGKYTIKGFRYLWMTHHDFITTPIKDLRYDGQGTEAWRRRIEYDLDQPVEVQVRAGRMTSLGSYTIRLETVGSTRPLVDDRHRPRKVVFESVEPGSVNALGDMKNWRLGNWPAWNERNEVPARP